MKETAWVYVIVRDPEGQSQILGLKDDEAGVQFIPAFISKEDAEEGMYRFPREKGAQKQEIQAIILEDLIDHAKSDGFMIFILDKEGKVTEKI